MARTEGIAKAMMAELDIPIPSFKQKEWRDERKKAVKEILTDMQTELRQAKEAQKKDILKLGKSLYDMAMEHIQELIEQDKQLHKENERLAAENEELKDKISRMDDKAITNLRKQKNKEIGELEACLDRANADASQSRSLASREQQRADKAEQQLQEMLAVPEIKDIWDSILQSRQAFWQQVDNWIIEAKDAIRTFTGSGLSLISSEQETVISSGIVGEALKDGLDASDLSQRKQATKNLLDQVNWTDLTEYKCNFGILRTNQLCTEMNVTKEMMTTLLLAAGGHGGVSSGGGGVSGELTNWDGTKKRNGWSNGK